MVQAGVKYVTQNKLYIWKKQKKLPTTKQIDELANKKVYPVESGARLGASKLRDLAWSLDVLDLKKGGK